MELGNFLGKLKGEKKEEPKKFLALVLTDEVVQASVWSVVEGQTETIAIGTPVEWDGDTGTTSELITAVDATISSATEGLEDEPSEVILGVPHSWTDKHGILGVKKEFIGKIRKELELVAIGYVVITDSVLSYLKMQEGTPTTSILIQVSRDELTLVLVRLGRIEGLETIGRSDDVVEDVTEGIARFKSSNNLPSRIILFNSMHDLDDITQNLLSVNWQTQFNFLHMPKIEALGKDVAIRALSVAGGSEVAKSLGFTLTAPIVEAEPEDVPAGPGLAGPDNLPARPGPNVDPEAESDESDTDLLTAEEIGFTSSVTNPKSKIDFIDPDDEPVADDPSPLTPGVKGAPTPGVLKPSFVMPKLKLPKLTLPTFKLNFSATKPIWWYLGGGIVLLVLLLFFLIWLMPRAVINVSVTPKVLDQDVDITLSTTDSGINFADRIVPASIETVSESGEKMAETTGKKIVGEAAKGEVTIYNRTSAGKTFLKGTTLSSGSLKFTLDSDVTVASKSAGSDYVDVPGKATVSITATTIGSDSNLAGGTELTVQNFGKDSYVAKNDSPLTGGTSEEVRIVSKEDQSNLVKDLTAEILEKLKATALSGSVSSTGVYLVEESAKVKDVTYSAKVGETATTLTASLVIQATLLRYQTEAVTTLVNSTIDQAVPSGFVRASLPSTVDLKASEVSEDQTSVKGTAKVKVALIPVIDRPRLLNALRGVSAQELENILSQVIPGYSSALVQITPAFIPARLKSIPPNPSNIQLNIVPIQ